MARGAATEHVARRTSHFALRISHFAPAPLTPEQAYDALIALSREETMLASCLDLLEWDEEVAMPRKGVAHRAEQRALLAGLVHDRATDPRHEELLVALEGSAVVSDPESAQAARQGRVLSGMLEPDGLYLATGGNVPVALMELQGGTAKVVRGFNLTDTAE